ncbi:MAG TPA: NAD-dependent succinate-semialdehyde dehydrogenase [Desulfobacterales bacterium]
MSLKSVNPATGETCQTYPETSSAEIERSIRKADEAFHDWKRLPFARRAERLNAAAGILRENRDNYAELMAVEMGKPIRDGRAESDKCAWVCEYFARQAPSMLAPESIESDAGSSFVVFAPLGVVLAVMPWNYPFWQVFRFAAPALMAGNTAILKHASNVPGCALAIESIFDAAGFPPAVFQSLLVPGSAVESIIADPRIRAVTLTGSTAAGESVAANAGKHLKKTVLELGGSDPYVVLEDADLEHTVATCVTSRLLNSGQSCIAAKRFIVVESARKRFEEMLVEQMAAKVMGDPLNDAVEIGPQARIDLRDDLHRQVRESIANGARCLLGGQIPEGNGAYYPCTVLTDVAPGMPAYEEETFGPVAAVISVPDEAEAIRVANDTPFGLGAAVFTADVDRGRRIAVEHLEAGSCFVNDFVKSDPRLPFGGIRQSGYGRELSHYGIKEFVNIKTIYIR